MRFYLLTILILSPGLLQASGSEADPYSGMNAEALRRVVGQLEKELEGVKKQLDRLEGKAGAKGAGPDAKRSGWLLDDFESGNEWDTKGGGGWWSGHDNNGMGTTREPDPFKPQKGGSPASPGYSGRLSGFLGPNEEPWAWSTLEYNFGDQGKDIREYKGLEFWIKGNQADVRVQVKRAAVTDYCYHEKIIKPGTDWQKVYIPFDEIQQADWGKQVAHDFKDIKAVSWSPALHEAKYDFAIDQIRLIK